MSLLQALTSRMAGTKTYVDDVFSTYLYTGNGSTQTITNGIDLAGKGGLVWIKKRGGGIGDHHLYDTVRGATNMISANTTGGTIVRSTGLTAFNSNGFSIGAYSEINGSGDTQVSWTFRKAPKFFDMVTFTGDGTTNGSKSVSHSLGVMPGMVIIKRTDGVGDWAVTHRNAPSNGTSGSLAGPYNYGGQLNTTAAFSNLSAVYSASATDIKVIDANGENINGATYVAYLFAHDTSADGIIQCGSFTTDGSGNATVTLGWEPQYITIKRSDSTSNWQTLDTMRGWSMGTDSTLFPNLSDAESTGAGQGNPTATGFQYTSGLAASATYIYLAIRRPNKPPTSGTQVYNAIARTGTGAAATVTGVGFAPDLAVIASRNNASSTGEKSIVDRLRGASALLYSQIAYAEITSHTNEVTGFLQNGISLGLSNFAETNFSGDTYINHFFKRAPGVFDQVCYTGTGVAKTEAHNLGVVPELMISKTRGTTNSWQVWCKYFSYMSGTAASDNCTGVLNGSQAFTGYSESSSINALPTASVFSLGTQVVWNGSGNTAVMYLFATKAGISKVGSYTGNGSNQTINCGFTTGARFILIKRTDFTGNWFVWDSVRGIVAGNDPHLSLNTTAAEVTTDDSIDPDTSGFIVNQDAATNINVNAATYIYLSLA